MKESASEEASIARYSDFESDDFVIGRLRRHASGGNLAIFAGGATPEASDHEVVRLKIAEFKVSIRNRCLEAFLGSKINKKLHFEKLRVSAFQF